MKLNIMYNLKEEANRDQEFISAGISQGISKNRMNLEEVIKSSFRQQIKSETFKSLSIANKIDHLLKFIEQKGNTEYVQITYKSIMGKDFSSFIASENKVMKSIAIVVRLNEKNNDIFYKNSVVIDCEIKKMGNSKMAFSIKNITLMNLPSRPHQVVRGIVEVSDLQFEIEDLKDENFTWLSGLKKPIDIWKDDSNLNIGTWKNVTKRINEFNLIRKYMEIPIFTFEKECKVKSKQKIKLVVFLPKDVEVRRGVKYFLNNKNDSELKGQFKYSETKENLEIIIYNKLNEKKIFILNKIKNISISLEDTKKTLSIEKQKNKLMSDVLKDIEFKFKNDDQVIRDKEKKVIELESKISDFKSSINEKEKYIYKLKKNKSTTKDTNVAEEELKIINNELNHFLSKHKKNIEEDRILIFNLKKTRDVANDKFNEKKNLMSASNKEILNIEKNNNDFIIELNKQNKNLDTIDQDTIKMERYFKEITPVIIEGTASIDEKKRTTFTIDGFDCDDFIKNSQKIVEKSQWLISDHDNGFATVIKRNNQAMMNLSNGSYKSPYLAIDLNNPNTKLSMTKKDYPSTLNEKQGKAFIMINNSYQSSFLQGPPGTGKTQVISAQVSHLAKNGEISLISSSTNEAINNAMDRINKDQKDNPEIIFLRVSNNKNQLEKAANFTEEKIGINLIKKMILKSKSLSKNDNIANKIISSYDEKLINKYFPKFFLKALTTEKVIKNNIEYFAKLLNINLNNEEDKDHFYEDNASRINKLKRVAKEFIEENSELSSLIETFLKEHNEEYVNNFTKPLFEIISQYNQTDEITKFDELISKVENSIIEDGINDELDRDIIELVEKYNLVNVIGITTTSKQILKINGVQKEIFTEYPIDFAVVDEVSKSITPEIIQISSLANKFLYAGDYRQLPPAADIASEYIEEFWKWNKQCEQKDLRFEEMINSNSIITPKDFEEFLRKLFKSTLFKNQVIKLKGVNKEVSYTALDRQYRFTEEIAELVNIVYDDDEKLITNFDDQYFNKYKINEDISSKKSTNIIDTSYISDDFSRFLINNNARKIVYSNEESFDQKTTNIGEKRGYGARFNEFNAFVGIESIMSMKKNNPNLDPKNIGYICMTRSQVNVITNFIKSNFKGVDWDKEWLSSVKFDTVDNFQGREKDVVFVDLVRAKRDMPENSNKINSPKTRILDHYSSCERLNVAISRAKSKLIILGALEGHLADQVVSEVEKDGKTYNIKIFEKFQKLIMEKGCVIKVW